MPDVTPAQGATIVRRLALVPILAAVLLFPTTAAALGLGEIEVNSALNQRLDARIPLRGVPAGGAEDVIVALASERAFRDVGLQRPHALTRLRFQVRARSDGGHYIHVTSSEPIAEPFLSFLLEVDGPGGNLLREYTVLLDPPVFATRGGQGGREAAPEPEPTAPAPAGSEDEAAAAPMSGEIARGDPGVPGPEAPGAEAATPAPTATAAPEPAQAETDGQPDVESGERPERTAAAATGGAGEQTEFGDTPVFLQVEREQARAGRERPEPMAGRAGPEARDEEEAVAEAYQPGAEGAGEPAAGDGAGLPAEYGPVERGDTLWSIASRLRRGDMTVQQLMLALLRYNPEAFADGNINRLRRGYVLRVPAASEVRSLSAQQAIARVREQNGLWREWRAAARGAGGDTTVAERDTAAPADPTEADRAAAADDAAEADESRLSIVGSREGGAGSDESASATTNGQDAAAEELELAREQLESARMEKAELESRVQDLEETVDKMERLITLRENQLAKLQDQLQRLQREEAERAEAAAETDADGAGSGQGGADAGATADQPADDAAAAGAGGDGDGGDGGTGGADPGDTSRSPEGADGGTATADADSGGAAAETDPAGTDPVATRTQPSPEGWIDRITGTAVGIASGISGVIGGTLAGFAGGPGGSPFAGPTSPGVLAAVALLLVALAGLLVMRRRRAAAEAEIEGVDEAALADAEEADEVDLSGMYSGSDLIAEELDSDEAAGGGGRAQRGGSGALEEALDLGALDADAGAEAATAAPPAEEEAPKDDTVAEAEVYLAYGLHQQAEDLLRLALRESPDRADYHEKLLETLYAAGKKGEFATEAGTFQDMVESTDSRMWQRVVAMGREIAPEHELFRRSAAPDVRPEELQKTRPATADIELDPGEGDTGTQEDDFARSLMPDADAPGAAGGDAGPREAAEAPGGDDSGELEFDLGDFEQLGGDTGESAEATLGADADAEDDALDFDLADLGGASEEEPAQGGAAATADEGGLDFDIGLDETAGGEEAPGGTGEPQGATAAGEVPDLDLGDLEFESGPAAGAGGGDDAGAYALDTDEASSPETDLAAATESGDEDDEFDTMLDLARAYIDMGDPESASNALEEVIESGSEKQRNEARSLLETVQ